MTEVSAQSHLSLLSLYAGFWRRFVAYLIDGIILSIAFWVLYAIATGVFGFSLISTMVKLQSGGISDDQATTAIVGGLLGFYAFSLPVSIVLKWLYFTLMESSANQATLGKMALSLKVTDLEGRRIGFGKATGRFFAAFFSVLTIFIGYLMAGLTPKKQALHDMMAGTLVLRSPLIVQVVS